MSTELDLNQLGIKKVYQTRYSRSDDNDHRRNKLVFDFSEPQESDVRECHRKLYLAQLVLARDIQRVYTEFDELDQILVRYCVNPQIGDRIKLRSGELIVDNYIKPDKQDGLKWMTFSIKPELVDRFNYLPAIHSASSVKLIFPHENKGERPTYWRDPYTNPILTADNGLVSTNVIVWRNGEKPIASINQVDNDQIIGFSLSSPARSIVISTYDERGVRLDLSYAVNSPIGNSHTLLSHIAGLGINMYNGHYSHGVDISIDHADPNKPILPKFHIIPAIEAVLKGKRAAGLWVTPNKVL